MKYVLMFAGSVDEQEAWEKMPESTRAAGYERVNQWFEEHSRAGRITGGAELQGPSSATTVRIKNGKAVVTDGPFIEAKEIIGGFAVVEVKEPGRGARDGQDLARWRHRRSPAGSRPFRRLKKRAPAPTMRSRRFSGRRPGG